MKYSLDFCMRGDQSRLQAGVDALPKLNDQGVWAEGYAVGVVHLPGPAEEDPLPTVYRVQGFLRFIDEATREAAIAKLTGGGFTSHLEAGSWIRRHLCGDWETPPVPCVIENYVFLS